MADHPDASLEEHLWSVAVARIVLGSDIHVQAPPNLAYEDFPLLLDAGIDDWGGVSPVTLDHVNPEAPWPEVERLRAACEARGLELAPRLPLYPEHVADLDRWADPGVAPAIRRAADAHGLAREDRWAPGEPSTVPFVVGRDPAPLALVGDELGEAELVRLFAARGAERERVFAAADRLRREVCGDEVTYVVTRNIQYTNVCYFRCGFCAFSKGKLAKNLRGPAYLVPDEEIARRVREAWERGATEVCLQGGIHPSFTGDYYADVVETVKAAAPEIHVHAFSALEIWQGAATLGLDLETYLERLRDLGLGSLPGTAAEVLDDEVRAIICPDKVTTDQWLAVHEAAHRVGLRSNVTIMFGHVERPVHWARHLLRARAQQERSGGFTELVPLPFVPMEAPIYLAGRARRGPTFGEALLLHAVARLALHPLITNVQASWVKLGPEGVRQALAAGVNDLGGTLMNESISRSAGSEWGQELPPEQMESLIRSAGRRSPSADDDLRDAVRGAGRPLVRRRAARRDGQPTGARRRVEASCPAPAAGRAAFLAPSRDARRARAPAGAVPGAGTPVASARGRRGDLSLASGPWSPSPCPTRRCSGSNRSSSARGGERRSTRCTPATLVSGRGRTGWCRSPRRRRASARRSTRARARASGALRARRSSRTACPAARPASRGAARRARPRARRSRGCDGRGAGAPPPALRARVPARAPARGAPGRRARHARPRRARATFASSARRRATRSRCRRGRRRSGSPRCEGMRRRHRRVAPGPPPASNLPQGHSRVPGATLATIVCRTCAECVAALCRSLR